MQQQLEQLAANAEKAASLLKAMSNSNRLMILCCLIDGEQNVGQLNNQIPLSQSALSQHLAALRKADLVTTRRESQTIYYRLQGDEAIRLLQTLKAIYCSE